MKIREHRFKGGVALCCVLLSAAMIALISCESRWDSHDPPPGQGSLVVDNESGDRLHVYLEGRSTNDVGRYDYEVYDLDPGLYRVVVDDRDGYRAWRGDIDVLESKITVMEVMADYMSYGYRARVYFD